MGMTKRRNNVRRNAEIAARSAQDRADVVEFLNSTTIHRSDDCWVTATDLLVAHTAWATSSGRRVLNAQSLGRAMAHQHGVRKVRARDRNRYAGICVAR